MPSRHPLRTLPQLIISSIFLNPRDRLGCGGLSLPVLTNFAVSRTISALMLHIRLRRIGKKKQPSYRLIVCEKTKDPWGDYLENLGTYNPRSTPSEISLKADRIKEWIAKGAQCSDTVWNILVDQGVVTGEKRKTIELSEKRKLKLSEKEEAKKAKETEAAQKQEEVKEQEGEDVGATPRVAQQGGEQSSEPPAESVTEATEAAQEEPASAEAAEEDKEKPAEESSEEPKQD
jgi:small subunit ribosomal protein S16